MYLQSTDFSISPTWHQRWRPCSAGCWQQWLVGCSPRCWCDRLIPGTCSAVPRSEAGSRCVEGARRPCFPVSPGLGWWTLSQLEQMIRTWAGCWETALQNLQKVNHIFYNMAQGTCAVGPCMVWNYSGLIVWSHASNIAPSRCFIYQII